jgi:hypothetical protein
MQGRPAGAQPSAFGVVAVGPASGPALQVTRGGGYAAQESWNGRYLYYSRTDVEGGLWRGPVEGGEESQVPGVRANNWSQWALSRTGIYWPPGRHPDRGSRTA